MKELPQRKELGIALLLCMGLFVSIPLDRGGFGLSWDSMNHHVYLGWVASQARFDQDFFAAASQSYQFPYLFWPVYKMIQIGFPGWLAGVIWAALHAMIVVPLWLLSRALIIGEGVFPGVFRVAGALYGVFSILVLRSAETTGNDVLAAMPLVWAIAIAIADIKYFEGNRSLRGLMRLATLVGLLGGVSVALKLSNGVMVFALPLIYFFYAQSISLRVSLALVCGVGVLVGFGVVYGWWGWQLWVNFGNPVFPFYDSMFEPFRSFFGWQMPVPR